LVLALLWGSNALGSNGDPSVPGAYADLQPGDQSDAQLSDFCSSGPKLNRKTELKIDSTIFQASPSDDTLTILREATGVLVFLHLAHAAKDTSTAAFDLNKTIIDLTHVPECESTARTWPVDAVGMEHLYPFVRNGQAEFIYRGPTK